MCVLRVAWQIHFVLLAWLTVQSVWLKTFSLELEEGAFSEYCCVPQILPNVTMLCSGCVVTERGCSCCDWNTWFPVVHTKAPYLLSPGARPSGLFARRLWHCSARREPVCKAQGGRCGEWDRAELPHLHLRVGVGGYVGVVFVLGTERTSCILMHCNVTTY